MSQMMWSTGCIIISLHYPKDRTSLSYLKVKFVPNGHLHMTILSQSLITSMLSIHNHSTSCSHDLLSIHRQDKDFECLHHLTHATCHDVTPSDRKQILVMQCLQACGDGLHARVRVRDLSCTGILIIIVFHSSDASLNISTLMVQLQYVVDAASLQLAIYLSVRLNNYRALDLKKSFMISNKSCVIFERIW